ncbi:MAG: HAMP domain-containing sensor histidine kinase, partial [Candidatus Binataceae bacterium]
MWGFLFIGLIVFAIVQKRRHRMGCWTNGHNRWFEKGASKADYYTQKWERKAERIERRLKEKFERDRERFERRQGSASMGAGLHSSASRFDADPQAPGGGNPGASTAEQPQFKNEQERQAYLRARKRAAAEAGFYVHLMWYGTVIGFLFLINLMTGSYPWFLWPAIGWGFGLMSHFSAVFGWRWIHERVFQPAIQREVLREVQEEKEVLRTEKQASLDELTATFAHEIRNPIAAAKSLVQQMGEDPTSVENVEYAKVALEELARVERSVSHLLKYAKEEDYHFDNVNIASVLDAALTQMRAKLEAKSVAVSRNYLGGPTVRADYDKLRQVFSNVIDNAMDAMENVAGERRLEIAIQVNGGGAATVRVRDNGCGIPPEKLGKIFNPFFTSKANGTGLGMAVAKKVIEAHRGSIEVLSQAGAGTEFVISVPLSDGLRAARAANSAEHRDEDASRIEPPAPAAAAATGEGANT